MNADSLSSIQCMSVFFLFDFLAVSCMGLEFLGVAVCNIRSCFNSTAPTLKLAFRMEMTVESTAAHNYITLPPGREREQEFVCKDTCVHACSQVYSMYDGVYVCVKRGDKERRAEVSKIETGTEIAVEIQQLSHLS